MGKTENRAGRLILFFIVGGVFWTFVFGMLYRLLRYFRGIPEIGALLAGKLLAVMFVSLFGILILSNVVTALSSFFARQRELREGPSFACATTAVSMTRSCAVSNRSWT